MTSLGMICRCQPEGAAECDALRARATEVIGLTDPSDFVSAIVMEINWKHNAYVELAADQWFGVQVIRYGDGDEDKTLMSATCDRIEDGLAACFLELAGLEGASK